MSVFAFLNHGLNAGRQFLRRICDGAPWRTHWIFSLRDDDCPWHAPCPDYKAQNNHAVGWASQGKLRENGLSLLALWRPVLC